MLTLAYLQAYLIITALDQYGNAVLAQRSADDSLAFRAQISGAKVTMSSDAEPPMIVGYMFRKPYVILRPCVPTCLARRWDDQITKPIS